MRTNCLTVSQQFLSQACSSVAPSWQTVTLMLFRAEIFFYILLVRSETSSQCNKPIYCRDVTSLTNINEDNILSKVSVLRRGNQRLSLTDGCRQQHALHIAQTNTVNIGFIAAVNLPISKPFCDEEDDWYNGMKNEKYHPSIPF